MDNKIEEARQASEAQAAFFEEQASMHEGIVNLAENQLGIALQSAQQRPQHAAAYTRFAELQQRNADCHRAVAENFHQQAELTRELVNLIRDSFDAGLDIMNAKSDLD